jgi:DNA polymerase-3 subunit delta'
MRYFSRMFRNELLVNQKDNSLVKATADELKTLETYAPFFTLKNALPLYNECNKATYHLERNANTMLVFTDFYFKLAQYFAKK